MCSIISFLNAKNVKPARIHRELAEIYGDNLMTGEKVGLAFQQCTNHGLGGL